MPQLVSEVAEMNMAQQSKSHVVSNAEKPSRDLRNAQSADTNDEHSAEADLQNYEEMRLLVIRRSDHLFNTAEE